MSDQLVEKLKKNVNIEYMQKFPFDVIEKEQFLPINVQNNILFVALVDAHDKNRVDKINSIIKEHTDFDTKSLPVTQQQFNMLTLDYKNTQHSAVKNYFNADKKRTFTPPKTKKRLGDMLIEAGLINEEQLMNALAESKKTGEPIGSVLVKLECISIEQLQDTLSEQQGIESIQGNLLKIEKEVMDLLPEDFIIANKVVPVASDGKNLIVGMVNPSDRSTLNEIIYITGLLPSPRLITYIEFENSVEALLKQKKTRAKIIEDLDLEGTMDTGSSMWEQLERELQDSSSAVAKFANQIISDAIDLKASDIHIEPRFGKHIVRYRIDGILKKVLDIPEKIEQQVISRFKVVARMNIAEHRRAQDGTFALKYNEKSYDFRVNTLPVGLREKMVIRILQPSVSIEASDKEIVLIGASKYDIDKIKHMTSAPNGIILTSGPTGSGKTTTLYSILKSMNDEKVNITTIEDPVEIRLDGVNQTQVNTKADITFANCMRAILRQDPDIILVGEIRDYVTLEAAISAALTGHLVLSTIHTNSAAATVTRLVEMGAKNYLIASSLTGVIAQRLVRRLCPHCKEKCNPTQEETKKVIVQREDFSDFMGREIYKAKGCEKCGFDGYIGRLGVYEIMPINREIKKLIAQSAPDVEIEEVAISCGMRTLAQSCLEHILNGETTIEEFIRVLGIVSD